jgi:hypothetical protein
MTPIITSVTIFPLVLVNTRIVNTAEEFNITVSGTKLSGGQGVIGCFLELILNP